MEGDKIAWMKEDQKNAYELGAHEYLVKPVDPELLLKEGEAALKRLPRPA